MVRDAQNPRWSQYDLARELDIQRERLANWELERAEPKPEIVQKIAEIFGVPVEWFYNDEDTVPTRNPDAKANVENTISAKGSFAQSYAVQTWQSIMPVSDQDDDIFELEEEDTDVSLFFFRGPATWRQPNQMELLKMRGTSAMNRIQPGSQLLIYNRASVGDGDMVMARGPHEEVMLKWLHLNRTSKKLEVHSLNEDNDQVGTLSEWTIIGGVVMIRHGSMIEFDDGRTLSVQPSQPPTA